MAKAPQPILTFTEAYEKYVGKINDPSLRYPHTCKCGAEFLAISDRLWDHIRDAHKEKIVSDKTKHSLEHRRAQRQAMKQREKDLPDALIKSLSN